MKRRLIIGLTIGLVLAMIVAAVALASSVDESIVDTTAPTGSVTLNPNGSGSITINLTVTGNQVGTATFDVYRDWTLSGGAFSGSNPQTFTVYPRAAQDPATTFSTTGTVTVASSQVAGTFKLAVGAFNITNSNTTGAKLGAGNASNYQITVEIPMPSDTTPPVWTVPSDITAEATGPDGAVVTYSASASDPDDAVSSQSCSPASGSTFELGITTVNCTATDTHGNIGTAHFDVTVVDTTPPTLYLPANITQEAVGPFGNVVSFSATATDIVDGSVDVICLPVSGSTFSITTTTVTCSATDAHNNTATGNFTITVQDTTPPMLVGCDAPDGLWHADDVTLYCHYEDLVSGSSEVALITSVSANTETANAVASAGGEQACDAAGNCADSPDDIAGNMVDKKAPVVSCPSADTAWHATDQSVICTATDGGSGPASQSVTLSTSVGAGTETEDAYTDSQSVSDAVGNSAIAGSVGPFKIDKKAPTITINMPTSGSYLLSEPVAASFSCSDGGSGVASCIGTVVNGANIDTASVGPKTFTVNATDEVGNASSQSVNYSVTYATGGMCYGGPGHTILQPINVDGSSVFKQKSTVPAKFRVCDYYGNSIGTPGVVVAFGTVAVSNAPADATLNETVVSTTPDTAFRWSSSDQQWIFNINTKNLSVGKTYYYRIVLNDGTYIDFGFTLK